MWALAPKLVDEGFVGRPTEEGADYIGISDVRELVALAGETPNVLSK